MKELIEMLRGELELRQVEVVGFCSNCNSVVDAADMDIADKHIGCENENAGDGFCIVVGKMNVEVDAGADTGETAVLPRPCSRCLKDEDGPRVHVTEADIDGDPVGICMSCLTELTSRGKLLTVHGVV